jgi:hypothetical protein
MSIVWSREAVAKGFGRPCRGMGLILIWVLARSGRSESGLWRQDKPCSRPYKLRREHDIPKDGRR